MKKLSVLLVAVAMVLFAFGTANAAAFIDGNQIQTWYESPPGTTWETYPLVTIGSGDTFTDLAFSGSPFFRVALTNGNIAVTFLQGTRFDPVGDPPQFDGLHFQDTTGTGILSLSASGIDPSRITFDQNNIWMNFQGLTFGNGAIASVAITPTPIPGAVWLLGSGLLGLVGIGRKRLQK